MNTTDLKHLSIEDMVFHQPDSSEEQRIRDFNIRETEKKLSKQRIISLMIALIVIIAEFIARVGLNTEDTITHMTFLILGVLLLYNIVMYISSNMRRQMKDVSEKYQCMTGIVAEKYDSRHLTKTTRENVPSYILFHNEQGYCTTALPVKDTKIFLDMNVGDEILIIKGNAMGNTHYTFTK